MLVFKKLKKVLIFVLGFNVIILVLSINVISHTIHFIRRL